MTESKSVGDRQQAAAEQDTKHLWAIGILDAWAHKHEEATQPVPVFHAFMGPHGQWTMVLLGSGGRVYVRAFDTPWEARVASAELLLAEDPTLEGN